jgi:hypothetical protein
MCIYVYAFLYKDLHICIYMDIYIYMHIYIYIYIYINICIYVCTNIFIPFVPPNRMLTPQPLNQLILPVSSWAQWAGMLSKAEEIHVNAPPYHPSMGTMSQYIYHDDKKKTYFGRYDNKTKDVEFYWVKPLHSISKSDISLPKSVFKGNLSVSTLPVAVTTTTATTMTPTITSVATTTPNLNTNPKPAVTSVTKSTAPTALTTAAARAITKKATENKEMKVELSDKDSLFEKLRIKNKSAGAWWWEQMMEGK